MATGDAALAAGMDLVDGNSPANTLATEDNKTRDYIAERTSAVTTVAKGGTGADNAAAARANLGLTIATTIALPAVAGKVPTYSAAGTLSSQPPSQDAHLATKGYVDGEVGQKAEADVVENILAGELRQAVWNRDISSTRRAVWMSTPVAGFTTLGWASSSRRKKENITDLDVTDEQLAAVRLVEFDRVDGGNHEAGGIAEEFDEAGFGFLVYRDEDDVVEGIEYSMIGIALVPVVQRLIRRVATLEAALEAEATGLDLLAQRIAALEER